jgi:cytochrome c oxidase accessory protein FixG
MGDANMRADTAGGGAGGAPAPLYAGRKKVYPQKVEGRFRNIKWTLMVLTLGVYYFTPFIRWDRGPNAPDQAVLIDFPARRFYFFFIEIWPQEVYYITGLLILAAMALFLMNALAGRLWCGYLCPQTVWTDLFYAVERLVEGDRRERMQADRRGWTPTLVMEKVSKHTLWLLIAWWTGGAWVLYFADAPSLVRDLATFQAAPAAYLWIGVLTFTTYLLAGYAREQVCTYMCPWPRIQAALTDEWALNVTYRYDRGEPRMSVKQAERAHTAGKAAGDCIDCFQCVAVCPTGIDIRDGLQLECIQCGLCIDACDTVMDKVDRPRGLIGYDTDINIQRRQEGKSPIYRFLRPRTVIYAVIIVAVAGIMAFTLATRSDLGLNVIHDRNPLYVQLTEGGIRNGYTVRLLNKQLVATDYVLSVTGLSGASLEAVGVERREDGWPVITVDPDTTREVRVLVASPAGEKLPESTPISFHVTDPATGETAAADDFFRAP